MTPEIRFNMVYAQDAEVCLLNDVENMVVSMDAQTIPNASLLTMIKYPFRPIMNNNKINESEGLMLTHL